jgi:hypothetical protein
MILGLTKKLYSLASEAHCNWIIPPELQRKLFGERSLATAPFLLYLFTWLTRSQFEMFVFRGSTTGPAAAYRQPPVRLPSWSVQTDSGLSSPTNPAPNAISHRSACAYRQKRLLLTTNGSKAKYPHAPYMPDFIHPWWTEPSQRLRQSSAPALKFARFCQINFLTPLTNQNICSNNQSYSFPVPPTWPYRTALFVLLNHVFVFRHRCCGGHEFYDLRADVKESDPCEPNLARAVAEMCSPKGATRRIE